jgi:hypothetical protein
LWISQAAVISPMWLNAVSVVIVELVIKPHLRLAGTSSALSRNGSTFVTT